MTHHRTLVAVLSWALLQLPFALLIARICWLADRTPKPRFTDKPFADASPAEQAARLRLRNPFTREETNVY